jgi:hypothetical protein
MTKKKLHYNLLPIILGCLENANCPSGFTCQSHKCTASAGQVLIDSITIKTSECNGCTTEGVTAVLKGESVVGFPYGIPCATNKLDRDGTTEFGPGGSARFDGKLNGSQNDDEESMIGGCFHVRHMKNSKHISTSIYFRLL